MTTWTSSTRFDGDPHDLLDVLTRVDAIARWSPVPFHVADGPDRLRAGGRLLVEGGLLGRTISFAIDVDQADQSGISLRARGAFDLDVDYRIDSDAGIVCARVQTNAGRPIGRILASVANAMLSGGALDHSLLRVVTQARSAAGVSGPSVADVAKVVR